MKSHQNHWTLSSCCLCMNWEIPRLRFPRAWVRTRSINAALLPLILRPFCFRNIFSSLLVNAFTSFSIVQEISGRVFLSLTLFLAFASMTSRCCTQLLHAVSSTLSCEHTSCKDLSSEEGNFPWLNNFFIWTRGRNFSIWSPVDVTVVNGKHFPGKVTSRVGTGERQKGTPLVQPSLRHPSHVGVEENLQYSRKYCP